MRGRADALCSNIPVGLAKNELIELSASIEAAANAVREVFPDFCRSAGWNLSSSKDAWGRGWRPMEGRSGRLRIRPHAASARPLAYRLRAERQSMLPAQRAW